MSQIQWHIGMCSPACGKNVCYSTHGMSWSPLASTLSCTFFLTVAMIPFLRKNFSFISIFLWLKVQKSWLLNRTWVCFKPHAWLNAADLSLLTLQQMDNMLQVMVIAMLVFLELLLWAVPVSYSYRLDSALSPSVKKSVNINLSKTTLALQILQHYWWSY